MRYICRADKRQTPHLCLGVGAPRLDERVAREVLKVVQPLAVEAALKAEELAQEKVDAARHLLEIELEQARYEARLAARRYDAVDPEKRLVARELEDRWEVALKQVAEVEARLATPPQMLANVPDTGTLLALAEDLTAVWDAPDTNMALKQRIVRVLIREIVLDIDAAAQEVVLIIHWMGGQHSEHRVRKPSTGEHEKRASEEAEAVIRNMAAKWSDEEIARTLNRMKFTTGQGHTWTARSVGSARRSRDIPAYESANKDGAWITQVEASERLGVSLHFIRRLMREGVLPAHQVLKCAPWQIRVEGIDAPAVADALRRWAEPPCKSTHTEQEPLFTCLSRKDSQ